MIGDLGKSQLSSLLETVPGLASVLRSPVADAIVNMVRAGAGLRDFDIHEAEELVQYATRRGLIPAAEGTQLLDEVKAGSLKGGVKKKGPESSGAVRLGANKTGAKKVKAKSIAQKPVEKKAKQQGTAKTRAVNKKSGKKTAGSVSKGRRR